MCLSKVSNIYHVVVAKNGQRTRFRPFGGDSSIPPNYCTNKRCLYHVY